EGAAGVTFSVRVGGTDCSNGTVVTGANASGSYPTANTNVTTGIANADLSVGANTIRVCVVDAATNPGSATATVTKDITAPTVTIVSLSGTGGTDTTDPFAITTTATGASITWQANEGAAGVTFSVRV